MIKMLKKIILDKKIHKYLPNIGDNYSICDSFSVTGGEYIKIGDDFSSNIDFRLQAISKYAGKKYNPEVIIMNNVTIGPRCHIGCIDKVQIGNGVLMGSNVLIIDHQHGSTCVKSELAPANRELISKGPIIIGDNVWIGDNVAIMPGVSIGENVIIGTGSVVVKDIFSDTVVAGVPARIIRKLS